MKGFFQKIKWVPGVKEYRYRLHGQCPWKNLAVIFKKPALGIMKNFRNPLVDPETPNRFRASLAEHSDVVVGSFHLPLDQHRELVALVLQGTAGQVQTVAGQLQAMRGITNAHLAVVPVQQ